MKLYSLNGTWKLESMALPMEVSKFCYMTSKPFCAHHFILQVQYIKFVQGGWGGVAQPACLHPLQSKTPQGTSLSQPWTTGS